MEISKIPTTVRNVQGWYEKSIVRNVHGTKSPRMVRNVYGTNSLWYEKSGNRGRHAKIFGWAKSAAASTDVLQAIYMAYTVTHNIGIGDKQKSCMMCVKFSKEWKTILHIIILTFFISLLALWTSHSDRQSCATACTSTTSSKRPIAMNICLLN